MTPKIELGIDPINHPFTNTKWTSWDISLNQSLHNAYRCTDQKPPLCANSSLSQWHFKADSFVYLSISTNDTIHPMIVSMQGSLLESNHTTRNYTCGFVDLDSVCHFQLDHASPGLYSLALDPNYSFLLYVYIDGENTLWPTPSTPLTLATSTISTTTRMDSSTLSYTPSSITSSYTTTLTSTSYPTPYALANATENNNSSGTIQPVDPHAYLHTSAWIFSLVLFCCGFLIILGLFIEKNYKESRFYKVKDEEGFAYLYDEEDMTDVIELN